jgi:hypothetical protein
MNNSTSTMATASHSYALSHTSNPDLSHSSDSHHGSGTFPADEEVVEKQEEEHERIEEEEEEHEREEQGGATGDEEKGEDVVRGRDGMVRTDTRVSINNVAAIPNGGGLAWLQVLGSW